MAKRVWTPMQTVAMQTEDKTLLVSAAAGSGKTATLTERIIRSILREKDPIELSDILVVTFTKAAASELREKIGARIRSAIAEDPTNDRLQRQLLLLPGARISTIDSFCSDILRANCDRVGVSPTYRIADEAEAQLLLENILDGMINEIYEGRENGIATPEQMEILAECLTNSRSEGDLAIALRSIYEEVQDEVKGVGLISDFVEEYNPEKFTRVEHTPLGKHAMKRLHLCISHHKKVLSDAKDELITKAADKEAKRIEILCSDLDFISEFSEDISYEEAYAKLQGFVPAKSVSGSKDPTLPKVTPLRNRFKDDLNKLKSELFGFSTEEWRECFGGLYSVLSVLARILLAVDGVFLEEKRRRGALEYSDVARYTYACLWQAGERTDVAISQSKLYSAIYVDEYQDVNMIQHKIFEAISTPTDRFMVGDIKQSIYGFRGGDPDIFAEMKMSYPKATEQQPSDYASVFMSDNFRCDKGIIDFTNDIFDRAFSYIGASIGYEEDDRLRFAKVYEGAPPEYRYPEICLLPHGKIDTDDGEERLAPLVVAKKIRELIDTATLNDGTPVRPEHIAIIMRNAKGKAQLYLDALEAEGVAAVTQDRKDFFLNADVLLALCLLNTIDNPLRDVYLAGLLCSPIFDFTADEMVAIRAAGGESLYASLNLYVERHPEFEKGRAFLERLAKYRVYAEGTPVDALVARLYHDTGLLSLASKRGGKENLIRLYEYARSFESSSFKGLYNFINYLNGIIGRKNAFDKQEAPLSDEAVKIITAHSSKGLEYPIVFFVGAEEPIKRRPDGTKRLFFDPRIGIGAYLRTPSGLSLVDNPTAHIIDDFTLMRSIEEEVRVLYVILTRARERLFVVATPRKKKDGYLEEMEQAREHLSTHAYYGAKSHLDLILLSYFGRVESAYDLLPEMDEELKRKIELLEQSVSEAEDAPGNEDDKKEGEARREAPTRVERNEEFYALMKERFSYVYPHMHMTRLPEKLSVSALYPKILDDRDESEATLSDLARSGSRLKFGNTGVLPAFAGGTDHDESAKRGICTHLLFQFCDLDALFKEGAENELARLVGESFLSKEDAERVRIDEVEMFRHSDLLRQMLGAKKLWRELRFNVRLDAAMFTSDEELKEAYSGSDVLVQGVIDCLYEDENGDLHLVDYKTDRLTKAELSDRELASEKLYSAHSLQLGYYAEAVERMMGKRPVSIEVYSLPLGDTVDVDPRKKP